MYIKRVLVNMYEDIKPYDDIQTSEALKRVASHPIVDRISNFLYPGVEPTMLRNLLASISGVDDFQNRVMYDAIGSIVSKTSDGLTFSGLNYFRNQDGSFNHYLLLSNHRDIVLDPAIIQYILKDNNIPLTEIAVGDNLISSSLVEDLMRSNRMIKVKRSGSVRELYSASKNLSEYMRMRLNQGSSVWIANRNGRTKNGFDQTSQGILKMFSMSGSSDFEENFSELHIMPVSISYEIEPCGLEKALETYLKERDGEYFKSPGEDLRSILAGIMQQKGHIHISFCKPLTAEEISDAASYGKNDNMRRLCDIIDERIVSGYHIWNNNLIAAGRTDSIPQSEIDAFDHILDDTIDRVNMVLDQNNRPFLSNDEIVQLRSKLKSIYSAPANRV